LPLLATFNALLGEQDVLSYDRVVLHEAKLVLNGRRVFLGRVEESAEHSWALTIEMNISIEKMERYMAKLLQIRKNNASNLPSPNSAH
jgi:hypothetical protein